ncbi:hypothetical protein DAPPUDRAFT_119140 [Daphnia pulex]|uniref:RNA ligase domain-containing protein n=1 Tax=Daphnia pulex TaxID=6669 RepID=E9HXK9_DAPPU|nr:hypothetical protein DAPPUDRAFT_119140 [Daphnia pulex]|eukprot:EFX63523.1 hypothetical protein DAPPUDRAFT_119140 [Daphnia pulex]
MAKINEEFKYQWSKTIGFFTHGKDHIISELINKNGMYYVSEKLDGSNMAVSTEGYIASRHKIIATTDQVTKFQSLSLEHVIPLFDAVNELHSQLKTIFFPHYNFKVIVYGEFMPNGTASSKYDIYNYVERGYQPGRFYAFGIGLVFDAITENVKADVERIFRQAFLHCSTKQEAFYLAPIDWFLTGLFYKIGIDCVRLHSEQPLQNILARSDLMNPFLQRQLEGYIFTSVDGRGMLKLKIAPAKDDYFSVFDCETFKSYFNVIYEREKPFIEKCMGPQARMEDHYGRKLLPQVKCEIRAKIQSKLRSLIKLKLVLK